MLSPITSLILSVALTWVMVCSASLARSRAWTLGGLHVAFGNRDDVPEAPPWVARADRAAKNMLENLVLFAATLLGAWMAKVPSDALACPCLIFLIARLVYAPLYYGGVKYLRTVAWAVAVGGVGWIGWLAVQAA